MKVKMPKTIEEFQAIRKTILDMMANPYCDEFMFRSLSDKLDKTDAKIVELKAEANG